MELISPVEILSGLRDLCDRFQTPTRIEGRTRYVLQRDHHLQNAVSLLHSPASSSTSSHDAREQDPLESLPPHIRLIRDNEHKLHVQPVTCDLGSTRGRREALHHTIQKARQMLHRDELQDLCNNIERVQRDHDIFSMCVKQFEHSRSLDSLKMHAVLNSCSNIEAGQVLYESCLTELDHVPRSEQHKYRPLITAAFHVAPHLAPACVQPVLGIAPPATELFADLPAVQRFAIVRDVVVALALAHHHGWYHRRLSTATIAVNANLLQAESSDATFNIGDAAKVLHFRCPITTGCFDSCSHCKHRYTVTSREARHELLHSHYAGCAAHTPVVSFCNAFNGDAHADQNGALADATALAAFIAWLYSGKMISADFDVCSPYNEPIVECVPWPLRWLIANPRQVTMRAAQIYLNALQCGVVTPHMHCELMPTVPAPPARAVSEVHAELTEEERCLLQSLCRQSVMVGTLTNEPQAALHLAKLYEDDLHASDMAPFENAAQCYERAAKLGDPLGYLHLARLHATELVASPQHVHDAAYCSILYLLLEAGDSGCAPAIAALKTVMQRGLRSARSAIHVAIKITECARDGVSDAADMDGDAGGDARTADDGQDELLDAVVLIGQGLRKGLGHLPFNLGLADAWLQYAHRRGRLDAKLELALLALQCAKCAGDAKMAVQSVLQVSNSRPNKAGYWACYWRGMWLTNGLYFPPAGLGGGGAGDEVGGERTCVVAVDLKVAMQMFEKGVAGGHGESIAMLSKYYRMGITPVAMDTARAKKLNETARKKDSMSAFCAYALMKEEEAIRLFRRLQAQIADSANGDGARVIPRGSSSSVSTTSSGEAALAWYSMETVDQIFGRAVQMLLDVPSALGAKQPQELYNPLPLYVGGFFILNNVHMWSECASSVAQGKESQGQFRRRWRDEAMRLLDRVCSFAHNVQWQRLRCDYAEADLVLIGRARNRLDKLKITL